MGILIGLILAFICMKLWDVYFKRLSIKQREKDYKKYNEWSKKIIAKEFGVDGKELDVFIIRGKEI